MAIKKVISVLLAVCFVLTVTVGAASAGTVVVKPLDFSYKFAEVTNQALTETSLTVVSFDTNMAGFGSNAGNTIVSSSAVIQNSVNQA